ncbi:MULTISPECIES: helix-turn-helix domain-containing protein [unclassified Nocardia]|uniref:helix-turn-helix domain-containing protein n=1 Tax=unclassified Nocardia TaxID=2637762 RepID=UPI001CE42364|nr:MULTISPECIES: helix-turn-helix domain-containing protein [unclassified Nocardia]
MEKDTLDLLLHPVRLRILHAMSGGHIRSTAELCETLPDIPKTTLYRHVGLLADGGILEVADEQRVRGTVERYYRLRPDRTRIEPEAGATMSAEEHRNAFAASMAVLLAEFNAYLDRPGVDPYTDSVTYRQGVVWLNQHELAGLLREVGAAVGRLMGNRPESGRTPYTMSSIMFPNVHAADSARIKPRADRPDRGNPPR